MRRAGSTFVIIVVVVGIVVVICARARVLVYTIPCFFGTHATAIIVRNVHHNVLENVCLPHRTLLDRGV